MNLAQFPRRRYMQGFTPIEKLNRLTALLAGPEIYMKRDDLLGLAAGGNKTRKLEFLMADALAKDADTVITCGAVQSNHCRLTVAAAVKEGLNCRLVLEQRVPGSYRRYASGNNFLYDLLGVEKVQVVAGGSDVNAAMEQLAAELREAGRRPYIIPGGGSNEIGALGYVACAEETLVQLFDLGMDIDHVILTSGSAGTHAGFLTGFKGCNAHIPVAGISINRPKEPQTDLVYGLARQVSAKLRLDNPVSRDEVAVYDEYVGEGYSRPTAGMVEAVRLLAESEAILMDPVYTGKAMAGMIDLIRKGVFCKGQKLLFLHTGGSPALYAYTDTFFGR